MNYFPNTNRYHSNMRYNKCGNSGLFLPMISLGLWQNFGINRAYSLAREIILESFDLGITHFDIANNYGPPAGAAEETFARVLKDDLKPYRDELIISTKAGHDMWPGPYGSRGSSRKYLMSSIDQSLKRLGLDYVDIFYSHCYNDSSPLEETMMALHDIVKQGKALYVGISAYDNETTKKASDIIESIGTKLLIHQPNYSILNRTIENGLQDTLKQRGIGTIAFCPLAQGLLTSKYINEIPSNSRAGRAHSTINTNAITPEFISNVKELNEIAQNRGQTLAQMSLAWVLRDSVTSALVGASSVEQIRENVKAIDNFSFTPEEIYKIDEISL